MADFISTVVQWVVVPLIMFAVFAFSCVIVSTARTPESRVSSWAGLFAGLVIFVVYVVSQLGQIREPDFRSGSLPGLLVDPLGRGLAAGFIFLGFVRIAVPTRLVGLITLTLSASSTSAVFTYTFIDQQRVSVLYWTLGASLGILLHIVFFPTSIEHIFGPGPSRGRSAAGNPREAVPEFLPPTRPVEAGADASCAGCCDAPASPLPSSPREAVVPMT